MEGGGWPRVETVGEGGGQEGGEEVRVGQVTEVEESLQQLLLK